MMRTTWLAAGVAFSVLLAGSALAGTVFWRPGVPKITVEVRGGSEKEAKALLMTYASYGGDPLRKGTLLRDQRVTDCRFDGALCVAPAMRGAVRTIEERLQTLQLRNFNGAGNPIVGVVQWTGRAFPSEVQVTCDLRIDDPAKACALANSIS